MSRGPSLGFVPRDKPRRTGLTYAQAGVNIDAGNSLVERIKPHVRGTHRPEMLSGLGGFAAMSRLPSGFVEPVLVTGTDGVGTKLRLAIDHDRHDDVGQDLVAMCVNDVLVVGAEPFLFLDYYATGALDVDVAERVIAGIARACELAGCALAGGETAEMPGFYEPGDYDLAGFCIGVAEQAQLVTGDQIAVGDRLIGLSSSGPHANGFALIRRILEDQGSVSAAMVDQLLVPTRLYVQAATAIRDVAKGMCHITGGGFVDNLPRMFAPTLAAEIDLDAWQRPAIFSFLQQAGTVADMEMLRTFNNGIGYVICVDASDTDAALTTLEGVGETPFVIGRIVHADAKPQAGHLVVAHQGASLG